jgi:hypothetical protein
VNAVGLRHQFDAGQVMVAHTEEFLYTVFYDPNHIPDEGAPDPVQIPGLQPSELFNPAVQGSACGIAKMERPDASDCFRLTDQRTEVLFSQRDCSRSLLGLRRIPQGDSAQRGRTHWGTHSLRPAYRLPDPVEYLRLAQ